MRYILLSASLIVCSGTAFSDDVELRQKIECAPGENFAKIADALTDLEEEALDTINTNPSFTLKPVDDGPLPQRIFHRASTGKTSDLNYSEDGAVTDFIALFENGKDDEFCVEDKHRAGRVKEDDAYRFDMRFNMNFHNTSGVYKMDELEDGLKDGKTALKKIVGGAKALFVPKLTHIYIDYADDSVAPDFQGCLDDGQCKALSFQQLENNYLISMEDLRDMDATELRVLGGEHIISPSMNLDKMAKAMGAEAE